MQNSLINHKFKNMKKLTAFIFIMAFSVIAVRVMAQQVQSKEIETPKTQTATSASASTPAAANKEKDEHPHMDAAKKALENAKAQLEQAVHDYNGHRAKALELVEQAIKEINVGIASEEKDKDKK